MPTLSMSAFGGKADIPDTPHQCPLMTHSGTPGSRPLNLNQLTSFSLKQQTYLVPEPWGLSRLRFSGTVAVLPPIAAHVIASSDALQDCKCV